MSLFNELKRRNVFRVGAAYAILAWLLIQIIDTVLPTFDAPRWIIQTVTFLIILGFPVTLFLAWIFELTPQGLKTDAVSQAEQSITPAGETDFARVKSNTLNAIILGLVVLAVGFLLVDRYVISTLPIESSPVAINTLQGETQRLSLVLPTEQPMAFGWSDGRSLAISPDGKTIAYVALDTTGDNQGLVLNVRELGSLQTRSLPGSEFAQQPFFSPDGQWVGFFTRDGSLKKVPLAGGRAITIVDGINGSGWSFATWLDNNNIVYAADNPRTLRSVSADGGEVSVLTSLQESAGEFAHFFPEAISGTDFVLFTSVSRVENQNGSRIEALDTTTGERQLIMEGAGMPRYLESGHLLFRRDDVNLVAPFDPVSLAFTGQAIPLRDEMRRDGASGSGNVSQLAVSRSGTLAYAPPVDTLRELYLVSRDGSSESLNVRADYYHGISVSPDGRYAALEVAYSRESETFLYDFTRQTTTRISLEDVESPFWRPDSRAVTLSAFNSGLWLNELDGNERLLVARPPGSPGLRNGSWHPDGNQFAITRQSGSEHDIMLVTLGEEIVVEPLLTGPSNEHSPQFSPNGRLLAYVNWESEQAQVYIRRFPEGEELIVSTGEMARAPLWSPDGSELFFAQVAQGDNERNMAMVAVSVTDSGESLQVSQPVALFPLNQASRNGVLEDYAVGGNDGHRYGILPDGHFLMSRGQSGAIQHEIVLVQNWFTEVMAMAPVE